MKPKFKKGQLVKIIGRDVPPECGHKIRRIKAVEPEKPSSPLRYILQVDLSDRWFHEDELELQE